MTRERDQEFAAAVAGLRAALVVALTPLLDLLARVLTREELVEANCPGAGWAYCVRGIFDRTLRCSACACPIPHRSHPTRRLKK